MSKPVKDYYELLQLSPNANQETIERTFRYLAAKWHPDAGGDRDRFNLLMTAFETLRQPAARATYDVQRQERQRRDNQLVQHSHQAGSDTVDRHKLLCLFYARRRQNPKSPGLGTATVESLMNCPVELLEFHLWYFREKGLIRREDNGGFSITADGVDHIETREVEIAKLAQLEPPRSKTKKAISRKSAPTSATTHHATPQTSTAPTVAM